MHRLFILLLAVVLALSGCDQVDFFDRFMPKDEVRLAQELVAKVAARDYAAIETALKPELRSSALQQQIDDMARLLPAQVPKSVKAVGYQSYTRGSDATIAITLEYEYADRWILAAVRLERHAGERVLEGINFVARGQSLEDENRFRLEGKGLLHWVVLVLAIAIPLFIIYALVLCVRTRFAKRKWPWVLFILIGFIRFQFNWSSGAWDVQPIAFMLLGSGFIKSGPYAPWIFSLSFPLGATLFLYRREALRWANEIDPAAPAPAQPTEPTHITEPGVAQRAPEIVRPLEEPR